MREEGAIVVCVLGGIRKSWGCSGLEVLSEWRGRVVLCK